MVIAPYAKPHRGKWGYRREKKRLYEVTEFGSSGDSFAAFLESHFFSSCGFCKISLSFTVLFFCSLISDTLHCLLVLAASWILTVTQDYCFFELPFGSALNFHCTFQFLFSPWNRFVIHFQGVPCDWVCLGRFSKNKPIKWPHSLQYLLSVWLCLEAVQECIYGLVWLCC